METLKNIALLIDADNTQLAELEAIIQEVTARGRITVKRAYGNWQKANLKSWGESLKNFAIRAEQQFDYVKGKNPRLTIWARSMPRMVSSSFSTIRRPQK